MITINELENKIESLLEFNSDFIILEHLLDLISSEEDIPKKELKSLLYQNKSKFYEVIGYIDGKRLSLQNAIFTSKSIVSKIIKKIERVYQEELTFEEKLKVLDFIKYNLEVDNANF